MAKIYPCFQFIYNKTISALHKREVGNGKNTSTFKNVVKLFINIEKICKCYYILAIKKQPRKELSVLSA